MMGHDATGEDLISTEDFNGLLDRQESFIRKYFDKHLNEKGFVPMVAIIGRKYNIKEGNVDEQIAIAALPPENFADDKSGYIEAVGHQYAKDNSDLDTKPVALFLMSEAWARQVDKAELDKIQKSNEGVSEHEDKREVIVATGMTLDRRTNMSMLQMIRDTDETIIGLCEYRQIPYEDGKDSHIESDLLGNFYKGYMGYLLDNSEKLSDETKQAIVKSAEKVMRENKGD